MTAVPDLVELIQDAARELNEELDANEQIPLEADARLLGKGGRLDSVGLVNLIVAVEQKLHAAKGLQLTLADERAFSEEHSPFRSLQSLAEYIARRIQEQEDE